MIEEMQAMLGVEAVSEISRAFHLMGIAEEEIALAKRQHPKHATDIHNAFLIIRPFGSFWQAIDELYRAHCREMLARIVRKDRFLDVATEAEILWGLMHASLKRPPSTDFACLYERLFNKVLPKAAKKLQKQLGDSNWHASYEGLTEEMYCEFRVKLRIEERKQFEFAKDSVKKAS